jgi:hypothetical protein
MVKIDDWTYLVAYHNDEFVTWDLELKVLTVNPFTLGVTETSNYRFADSAESLDIKRITGSRYILAFNKRHETENGTNILMMFTVINNIIVQYGDRYEFEVDSNFTTSSRISLERLDDNNIVILNALVSSLWEENYRNSSIHLTTLYVDHALNTFSLNNNYQLTTRRFPQANPTPPLGILYGGEIILMGDGSCVFEYGIRPGNMSSDVLERKLMRQLFTNTNNRQYLVASPLPIGITYTTNGTLPSGGFWYDPNAFLSSLGYLHRINDTQFIVYYSIELNVSTYETATRMEVFEQNGANITLLDTDMLEWQGISTIATTQLDGNFFMITYGILLSNGNKIFKMGTYSIESDGTILDMHITYPLGTTTTTQCEFTAVQPIDDTRYAVARGGTLITNDQIYEGYFDIFSSTGLGLSSMQIYTSGTTSYSEWKPVLSTQVYINGEWKDADVPNMQLSTIGSGSFPSWRGVE